MISPASVGMLLREEQKQSQIMYTSGLNKG